MDDGGRKCRGREMVRESSPPSWFVIKLLTEGLKDKSGMKKGIADIN